MQIAVPGAPEKPWTIDDAPRKLSLRAALPGARLFDFAAASLAAAKRGGVDESDRLSLALPASWLVNSPANSRVMRRWSLPPHRASWLSLITHVERGPEFWLGHPEVRTEVGATVAGLGEEPYLIEAVSKVLALLAPDVVPLMPAPARTFVLGADAPADAGAFVGMIDWFVSATVANRSALDALAAGHREATIGGAGALDRLLWFDSDGHQHFKKG